MFRILMSALPRLTVLALSATVCWVSCESLISAAPQIDPRRRELGTEVISRLVEDIRQATFEAGPVALLHFENDPTDFFTEELRSMIEQGGVLTLCDRPWLERARKWAQMRIPSYGTRDEALLRGREFGAEAVLYGRIHAFKSSPLAAEIDVEVELVRISDGQELFSKRYQTDSDAEGNSANEPLQESAKTVSWVWKGALWLVLVLLLPVFSIGFVRHAVRQRSNRVNAFVLAVYAGADALLAGLLFTGALASLWSLLLLLAAVAGACLYNLRIMTFALHLED